MGSQAPTRVSKLSHSATACKRASPNSHPRMLSMIVEIVCVCVCACLCASACVCAGRVPARVWVRHTRALHLDFQVRARVTLGLVQRLVDRAAMLPVGLGDWPDQAEIEVHLDRVQYCYNSSRRLFTAVLVRAPGPRACDRHCDRLQSGSLSAAAQARRRGLRNLCATRYADDPTPR